MGQEQRRLCPQCVEACRGVDAMQCTALRCGRLEVVSEYGSAVELTLTLGGMDRTGGAAAAAAKR